MSQESRGITSGPEAAGQMLRNGMTAGPVVQAGEDFKVPQEVMDRIPQIIEARRQAGAPMEAIAAEIAGLWGVGRRYASQMASVALAVKATVDPGVLTEKFEEYEEARERYVANAKRVFPWGSQERREALATMPAARLPYAGLYQAAANRWHVLTEYVTNRENAPKIIGAQATLPRIILGNIGAKYGNQDPLLMALQLAEVSNFAFWATQIPEAGKATTLLDNVLRNRRVRNIEDLPIAQLEQLYKEVSIAHKTANKTATVGVAAALCHFMGVDPLRVREAQHKPWWDPRPQHGTAIARVAYGPHYQFVSAMGTDVFADTMAEDPIIEHITLSILLASFTMNALYPLIRSSQDNKARFIRNILQTRQTALEYYSKQAARIASDDRMAIDIGTQAATELVRQVTYEPENAQGIEQSGQGVMRQARGRALTALIRAEVAPALAAATSDVLRTPHTTRIITDRVMQEAHTRFLFHSAAQNTALVMGEIANGLTNTRQILVHELTKGSLQSALVKVAKENHRTRQAARSLRRKIDEEVRERMAEYEESGLPADIVELMQADPIAILDRHMPFSGSNYQDHEREPYTGDTKPNRRRTSVRLD